MNLQTFIQLVETSTLTREQKVSYLSAAPLYTPDVLDAIATQIGVQPSVVTPMAMPVTSPVASSLPPMPSSMSPTPSPIVPATITPSISVTNEPAQQQSATTPSAPSGSSHPTPEQAARIAALDAEIAAKKEQLALIDRLFHAMRENAEEADEETVASELTNLEAQIAAL